MIKSGILEKEELQIKELITDKFKDLAELRVISYMSQHQDEIDFFFHVDFKNNKEWVHKSFENVNQVKRWLKEEG